MAHFYFHKTMHIKKIAIASLFLVSHAAALTKIWKNDIDIYNTRNWEGGKPKESCEGLSFDSTGNIDVFIDRLDVKKIYLPEWGTIHLQEGSVITFNEKSSDIMNCVRYKESTLDTDWMNLDNWIIQGGENNVAIPHKERLPCEHDDVVFPKGWKTGSCVLDSDNVKIKSLKFGNVFIQSEDFLDLYDSHIEITNEPCTDATGCRCGNENANEGVCLYFSIYETKCSDAIKPIGFCTEICGASIQFHPRADFRIENIRKSLETYTSDTYVSKVRNYSSDVIQIVFAEKEFTGASLNEAKRFFSLLLSDDNFGATNILLYTSSSYVPEGNFTGNAVSIIFGTLCGVLFVFAIFFFLYSPQQTAVRLRDRLRFSSPLSFKTNLFARFENTENAELIIGETQSLGGSILSLDKAFDNPLYGKSSPSTASTSYDTFATADVKVTRSEISVENPMYNLNNMDMGDNVEEVEQGELIDMTKKA